MLQRDCDNLQKPHTNTEAVDYKVMKYSSCDMQRIPSKICPSLVFRTGFQSTSFYRMVPQKLTTTEIDKQRDFCNVSNVVVNDDGNGGLFSPGGTLHTPARTNHVGDDVSNVVLWICELDDGTEDEWAWWQT